MLPGLGNLWFIDALLQSLSVVTWPCVCLCVCVLHVWHVYVCACVCVCVCMCVFSSSIVDACPIDLRSHLTPS